MTLLLGATLAAGMLLVAAPWLWPKREATERSRVAGRLERLLQGAGYAALHPRVVVILCLAIATVASAVAWLVTSVPAFVAVCAITGAAAPIVWLRARHARLIRTRRHLWPDVCDLLIASVRAGMSLPDAVATLATTAPAPLRPPFAAFASDVAASGHFASSVDRLIAALADPVADRILETLRMAREVGGTELTAVLRGLAASVRAEATLRSEVESRQSWVRGAAVLGVIAPWVVLVLLSLRPEGARAYASAEGMVLIAVGAAVSFVAFRLMLRIGRLPEPRRWFG